MSALWLLMFIQPRIFEALPQWPSFVHSWCLWKLLALLKMFLDKKKISNFCMGVIQVLYLVGNNFYLNVLNHRNVKGQCCLPATRILSLFTFILKHSSFLFFFFWSMHCFVFIGFFFLRGVLLYFLPIRVVLQPLLELWMNVSLFLITIELSACCWVETRTVFLFTVMTWRWLNCPFFLFLFLCVCAHVCMWAFYFLFFKFSL